ncbi:MAG: undecaprenyl/decaprenyl-phosphate alpha-N-acetylglucosaminyl 1-phosphate transferase, partial [Candidatus Omnitrophica bacterium]|nr:undecaprenyl/decaprenyl-phosphate alpha-N-acetylglucosaminyl 1-phosphate transferase [Candidatus Omnitrophota bacterium]
MLIFGLLDDCRELSIIAKFLVQIIATTVLVIFGIRTQIVYIGAPMNILITFIWVIGITNAFNHLDVMDAVAAATAMIVSLAFLVISILNNDLKTALFSLVLFGAVSGFMIFNFPPAKVYMGNSGSHFVGFVLAAMTLVISYAPMERKIALFSPLLILGLPIFDTLFVILMRISKRQLPFRKSADHLPLRFLALGYSKKQSLLFMCLLGVIFALFGIALSRVANLLGLIIIVAAFCLSTVITLRMSKVS